MVIYKSVLWPYLTFSLFLAVLSNNKHLVRVALNDLSTNTHIGPVVPNFMNLSILVLSEESIPVLAPTAHQLLHHQALNMLEALLINPCCADTDVTLQVILSHSLFIYIFVLYPRLSVSFYSWYNQLPFIRETFVYVSCGHF